MHTAMNVPCSVEYDYQDLLEFFSEKQLKLGADYISSGQVENVRRSQLGNIVTGRLVVANNQKYRLFIELSGKSTETHVASNGSKVEISSECTCKLGKNCKHAAAVLLQNLADHGHADTGFSGAEDLVGQVDDWLGELEALDRDVLPDEVPEDVAHQLAYFIYITPLDGYPAFSLSLMTVNASVEGKTPDLKPYKSAPSLQSGFFPRFVTSEDSHLIHICDRICNRFRFTGVVDQMPLRSDSKKTFEFIKRLVESGRSYWASAFNEAGFRQALRNQPIQWVRRKQLGRMDWAISDTGFQRLVPVADDSDLIVFPTIPAVYYDANVAQAGVLNVGVSESLLTALYTQIADIGPDQSSPVSSGFACLAQYQSLFSIPAMTSPWNFKRVVGEHNPTGKIILHSTQLSNIGSKRGRVSAIDLASLKFVYVHRSFSLLDDDMEMVKFEKGTLTCFSRNFAAEQQLLADLLPLKPIEALLSDVECLALPDSEFCLANTASWKRFMILHVPRLKSLGWDVEVHASFRHRYARVDEWQVQVNEKGEWFELSMGIHVNGEWRDLFPILINYLQHVPKKWQQTVLLKMKADEPVFIKLEDDIEIAIAAGRIRHILTTLVELFDERLVSSSSKLELPVTQFMRINELVVNANEDSESQLSLSGCDHLCQLAKDLKSFKGLEHVPPASLFKGELRSYQQDGLNWLQFLRHYRLGGVLADDMGLGKTIQTIAHLSVEKASGRLLNPVLIVAPTSLMGNWRSELAHFTPDLTVLTLHGSDRKSCFNQINEYDVVLTTYPLVVRDQKILSDQSFYYVILDEAQQIKNARAKASKVVRNINAQYKLCLTGTPMENHLGELWSLFDFLMPRFLGAEKQFRKQYRNPIEKYSDQARQIALQRRIAPFMLRRTKEAVASELPPKSEITRSIEILGPQRDLYESIRVSLNKRVKEEIEKRGLASSQLVILDSLLKLRQVCCDPRLVKLDSAAGVVESGKLDYLLSLVKQLFEQDRKILLFSQFTSMLSLIGEALSALSIPFVQLTGKTKDRDRVIDSFQNGDYPVFLISLKAGGTGLNLTAADTVIHYDPWWNPAVERQATDRAYRIGQDKPVFVYKLIGKGTVEEKIQALQQRKHALAEGIFSGNRSEQLSFSEEDLAILFEPLV